MTEPSDSAPSGSERQDLISNSGQWHDAANSIAGWVSGSVVQARDIGELNLRLGPAYAPPRQLPAAPVPFVNRVDEIAAIDRCAGQKESVSASPLVLITGGHGVGKSGTTRQWAHANSVRFADGQLYVDYGETRRQGAVSLIDVLGSLLGALGVDPVVLPMGLIERAALYRSRVAGRRVLVVLDDVRYAAEVTPLLPGSGGCCVLVTTRAPMPELLADGAAEVRVAPLDQPSAQLLLCEMLGPARVTGENQAVGELGRLCAGLPVALRICAAQLAGRHRRRTIAWLVARLSNEEERLAALKIGSLPSLQAVFDEGYGSLSEAEAELYRALGWQPAVTFDAALAAALVGCTGDDAEALLEGLAVAFLIEPAGERWRLHDLLRVHARQMARRVDSPTHRGEFLSRAISYYRANASRMDHAIIADRLRFADTPDPAAVPAPMAFAGPADALRWFEAERANLLAVLHAAQERMLSDAVWPLVESLWIAYSNHKHFDEAREVYAIGVQAAQASRRSDVEARMRQQLARALIDLERFEEAAEELGRAAELAVGASDRRLPASILEFRGLLAIQRGDYGEARTALALARAAFAAIGYRRGVALQEYLLGQACIGGGDMPAALAHLRSALELVDEAHDAPTHGRVLLRTGQALLASDMLEDAAATLTLAVDVLERADALVYLAVALETLADVRRALGRTDLERRELRAALFVHEALGAPRAEIIRRRLVLAR